MTRHRRGSSDVATPIAITAWQLSAVFALSVAWMFADDALAASAAASAGAAPLGAVPYTQGPEVLASIASAIAAEPHAQAALLGTILWTGIGTTAGCSLVEAAALGELSSAEATVVFSTEPLWGAAFAYLLLGEVMGPLCQLGGACMVAACILSGVEMPSTAVERKAADLPQSQSGQPPPVGGERAVQE